MCQNVKEGLDNSCACSNPCRVPRNSALLLKDYQSKGQHCHLCYLYSNTVVSGQSFSSTYSGISVLISDICVPVYRSICWVIRLKKLIALWGYFQRLKFPSFQANFKHPHRLNSFYIYKTHTQSPVKLMYEMWRITSLKDCLYFSAWTALSNVEQKTKT